MTYYLSAILAGMVIVERPNLPRHHPLSDEYRGEWKRACRNWKTGPNASAAVKRLDDRAADLPAQLARG